MSSFLGKDGAKSIAKVDAQSSYIDGINHTTDMVDTHNITTDAVFKNALREFRLAHHGRDPRDAKELFDFIQKRDMIKDNIDPENMLAKLINGAADYFGISQNTAVTLAAGAGILGVGGLLNKAMGNPAGKIGGKLIEKGKKLSLFKNIFKEGAEETPNKTSYSSTHYQNSKSYKSKYQSSKHGQILSDKTSGGLWVNLIIHQCLKKLKIKLVVL